MTKPELRADARQRAAVRLELHQAIDRICDHWPNIALEAEASVFASKCDGGGGGMANPTLVAAMNRDGHRDWMAHFAEMRSHVRVVAARAHDLDPPKAKNVGRDNRLEVCVKCGLPAVGEIRRIDGHPIHKDRCYLNAWRHSRTEGVTLGAHIHALAERLRENGGELAGQRHNA